MSVNFQKKARACLTAVFLLLVFSIGLAQKPVVWYNGQPSPTYPSVGAGNIVQTASGGYFTIGLRADGTVTAWGTNNENEYTATKGLEHVVEIAANYYSSYALLEDGTVVSSGNNYFSETALPADLPPIAHIYANSLSFAVFAVTRTGTVIVWGMDGGTGVVSNMPTLTNVKSMVINSYWAGALKNDGSIATWGYAPATPTVPNGEGPFVKMAGGQQHIIALKANGTVLGYGRSYEGQITIPAGLSNVVDIAASDNDSFSVAYKKDGSIVTWGLSSWDIIPPAGLSNITDISYPGDRMVALQGSHSLAASAIQEASSASTGRLARVQTVFPTTYILFTDNAAMTVPNALTVPASSRFATFPISSGEVSSPTDVTIYAFEPATNRTSSFTITVTPKLMTLSASSVVSGSTNALKAKVALPSVATSDVVLNLTSEDAALEVPATVTIRAGQQSATFICTHYVVSSEKTVHISATGDVNAQAEVTLKTFSTKFSQVNPSTLKALGVCNVVLTLNAVPRFDTYVDIDTDRPDLLIPFLFDDWGNFVTYLKFPAGSRYGTFQALGGFARKNVVATLEARLGGSTTTAQILIQQTPYVKNLFLTPSMWGHQTVIGKVSLTIPAGPDGLDVYLYTDEPDANHPGVHMPEVIHFDPGQSSASFEATAEDVATLRNIVVVADTGFADNYVERTVTVTPLTARLALDATTVVGGSDTVVTGTVTLSGPVGADTEVELVSSDPAYASVPATVTIPAGSQSVTFPVTHCATTEKKVIQIQVTKHGVSKSKTLRVTAR